MYISHRDTHTHAHKTHSVFILSDALSLLDFYFVFFFSSSAAASFFSTTFSTISPHILHSSLFLFPISFGNTFLPHTPCTQPHLNVISLRCISHLLLRLFSSILFPLVFNSRPFSLCPSFAPFSSFAVSLFSISKTTPANNLGLFQLCWCTF